MKPSVHLDQVGRDELLECTKPLMIRPSKTSKCEAFSGRSAAAAPCHKATVQPTEPVTALTSD